MAALWPRVTHRMCRARGGGWDLKQVEDSKVDRETKTSRVGNATESLDQPTSVKYNGSHMSIVKFSSSHIIKSKKKQVK